MLKTLLLITLALTQAQGAKPNHVDLTLEGWKVHLDSRFLSAQNKDMAEQAMKLLEVHLVNIKTRVPADKVGWMQQNVPIWLDLDCGNMERPQYHPNPQWLKEHGYLEEMAKGVQIPNVKYWLRRDFQTHQPLAILHEMAHGYHDQVLKFDNEDIEKAYEKFKASGKYEKVLRSSGAEDRHYGLTNPMEFFAEFTESYFNGNDFYPFNQGELKQAEPEIFELMRKIWGASST